MNRRELLAGALGLGALMVECAEAAETELRGIYPILQTPYTDADEVDVAALVKQARFLDQCGVHGLVWPQRASQYQYLTLDERIAGAEALKDVAGDLRPKLVIGVQGPDRQTAVRYAKHAQKLRPDAIIALPTRDQGEFDLEEVERYYAAIADVCDLPMFVQTTGNMSVEFVLGMAERIPTLKFVKDEAGNPIARLTEINAKRSAGRPEVFSGSHGRNLIDEMMRNVAGNMPASGWADLYVTVWNRYHAGRMEEALDVFSKILLLVEQALVFGFPTLAYVLELRGVFKNHRTRGGLPPLDATALRSIRATFEFVRPHFAA
jgi:4-hydroxy-tetrahydrodipicolinate synthase